jgi:hypothetical protein
MFSGARVCPGEVQRADLFYLTSVATSRRQVLLPHFTDDEGSEEPSKVMGLQLLEGCYFLLCALPLSGFLD